MKFSQINSIRQNTLPTRKAFPEKTTTYVWLTTSYEVWYCTSLLEKTCMLSPNVAIGWTIKDKMLLVLYILH